MSSVWGVRVGKEGPTNNDIIYEQPVNNPVQYSKLRQKNFINLAKNNVLEEQSQSWGGPSNIGPTFTQLFTFAL